MKTWEGEEQERTETLCAVGVVRGAGIPIDLTRVLFAPRGR